MKQFDAINTIMDSLKKDDAILSIFLKGSIASGKYDEWSDVDMYCLVDEDKEVGFLSRRIEHLESYKKIICKFDVNFVAPQIVAVFEDTLHLDLYTVTKNKTPTTDNIKILHDPMNLLSDYEAKSFSILDADIPNYFDEISFNFLEFEAAYMRKDYLWASTIASYMFDYTVTLIRHLYAPETAKLGIKKLNTVIDDHLYDRLLIIAEKMSPVDPLVGVRELINLIKEIAPKFNAKINTTSFNTLSGKVLGLKHNIKL